MKITKKFNKMSLSEQESELVYRISCLHNEEAAYRRLLAKVRGGSKAVVVDVEDRPDLIDLKNAKK